METAPFWLQLVGFLAPAVAVYVAIRVDLAVLKVRAEHNEKAADDAQKTADEAHHRINRIHNRFEKTS